MKKQRVLLVCSQQLFGESIEAILRQIGSMNLLGPLELSSETICSQLPALRPDAVIIAEETPNSAAASLLTTEILQHYPSLPIIRTGLSKNNFRVFAAYTLPARSSNLIEIIKGLPTTSPWDAEEYDPNSEF